MNTLTFDMIYASIKTVPMLPRVVESLMATELKRDWSYCRSPSRAKRRHAQGHRTRMREYLKPACYFIKAENTYYMHPALYKAMRNEIGQGVTRKTDNEIMKAFLG